MLLKFTLSIIETSAVKTPTHLTKLLVFVTKQIQVTLQMKNRAKYRIIFNFVHLLEQYPFEAITTKLICAHSNVNRSTFYANFKDKYNLYDIIQNYHKKKYINLLDTLYNDFEDVKSNNMKIHKFFVIVLKYIQRKSFLSCRIHYPSQS